MRDTEIKKLCRNGDYELAFKAIVESYSERLYWHVRRLLCSHEDTNDLLQDIFIKIWTAMPSFRGDSQLYTWLYRIAFNECLTFLNKLRANNQLSIDDADAEMINKLEGDVYFDGDRTQLLFQKAIQSLPEKQRIIFNLKYFQALIS